MPAIFLEVARSTLSELPPPLTLRLSALPENKRGAAGEARRPSTNSDPAGATDARAELEVGTGETDLPVPLVRTTGGGDGCRWYAPFRSGAAEAHRDKLGRIA
jgi:hypothetical protein